MFETETITTEGGEVLRIAIPAEITGTLTTIGEALKPYMPHPRVIIDFTAMTKMAPMSGMPFIQFLQQRDGKARTCIFGASAAVRRTYGTEFFTFIEPRELVRTEDPVQARAEAIARVTNER